MKIGILFPGHLGQSLTASAREVESFGFDSFWVGDHVLNYVDGVVAVAMAGAATTTITVGTAVCLVPFRQPVMLTRSISTIATELGDRLVFGAGVGGDVADELDVAGVDRRGRSAAIETTFRTLHDALDRGVVGPYEFHNRPPTGCPAIWGGGHAASTARRAARLADGYLPYLATPDRYAQLASEIHTTRRIEGRDGHPFTWAACVMASLHPDPELARRSAVDYGPFGLNETQIDRHVAYGDADLCAEKLRAFGAVGVEHLVLHVAAPPHEFLPQLERLAAVIDRLRSIPSIGRPSLEPGALR